jgi:histone H3/H4
MEKMTKRAITRLARQAGVKSISDNCFDFIRSLVGIQLKEIMDAAFILSSQTQSKTIMTDHIYDALRILGYNVTQSNNIGFR